MAPDHWLARSCVVIVFVVAASFPHMTARVPGASPVPANPAEGASPGQAQTREADVDAIVGRAVEFVDGFFAGLSGVVAEEEYVQTSFGEGASNDAATGAPAKRVLRSDYLLVRRPDNDQLMPFRDVFEVNGKPVRDRQDRLQRLFREQPGSAMADASRIAQESSRYNLGLIDRTVNTPTLPLQFLHRQYLSRFKFKKGKQEAVNGLRVWRIDYSEKAKPTLIRTRSGTGGDDVPAEGAFWIEGETGRVVKTRLHVVIAREVPQADVNRFGGWGDEAGRLSLDVEIVVTYRANDAVAIWVPAEMKETYLYGMRRVNATATYSNFRRVGVTADPTAKVPK